mmetsp:Transcript_19163/g.49124  ORF Transcript_19163/g.49124 Transcript_19163/m.49124 type:complete len:272 (-) Transcript_19163:516-1331(-)
MTGHAKPACLAAFTTSSPLIPPSWRSINSTSVIMSSSTSSFRPDMLIPNPVAFIFASASSPEVEESMDLTPSARSMRRRMAMFICSSSTMSTCKCSSIRFTFDFDRGLPPSFSTTTTSLDSSLTCECALSLTAFFSAECQSGSSFVLRVGVAMLRYSGASLDLSMPDSIPLSIQLRILPAFKFEIGSRRHSITPFQTVLLLTGFAIIFKLKSIHAATSLFSLASITSSPLTPSFLLILPDMAWKEHWACVTHVCNLASSSRAFSALNTPMG